MAGKGFEYRYRTPRNTPEERGGKPPVYSRTVEVGAGWIKKGQTSGEDYISLSLADPAFGPKKLYANLGQAAGQDDKDVFAVIWNTTD